MPNCVFSIIIMKKFQVLSHLRSHSKNTPTRTHFARTIPRGFAPLSHLKYRTHVCDRTSARTHVHTLFVTKHQLFRYLGIFFSQNFGHFLFHIKALRTFKNNLQCLEFEKQSWFQELSRLPAKKWLTLNLLNY